MKTRQAADVRFSDGRVVPCEIRDFSPTGLYLELSEQDFSRVAGPALSAASIILEFPGSGPTAGKTLQVKGKVAHYSDGHLGVTAEKISDAAFQAMLEFRAGLYRASGKEKPTNLDPVDARSIRIQCLSLYRPFLGRVIRAFFEELDKSTAQRQQAMLLSDSRSPLAGQAEVAQNRDAIRGKFIKAALSRVEEGASAPGAPKAEAQYAELTLIDESEFEDWLNLAAVINKLEDGLLPHLGAFERLYAVLTGKTPSDSSDSSYFHAGIGQSSPFSPDALCRSFQESLAGLRLDNAQRVFIYRSFGQAVAQLGMPFYESLSKIVNVVERRRRPAGSTRRVDDEPAGYRSAPVPEQQALGMDVGAESADPDTMGYSLDRILTAFNDSGLGAPIQAGAAGAAPVAPPAAGLPAGSGYAGVVPHAKSLTGTTGVLQSVVSQLSQNMPGMQLPYAITRGEPRPDLPQASTNEIMLALDSLIQSREGARPAEWQPSLTEQLLSRLAQAGGSSVRIAPAQQQLLDSLATLFDRVMQEYAPASELEALMKRFETPFFKLALKDPNFLIQDDHPARKMINLLDQFSLAADDQGKFFDPKLPQILTVLVNNILAKSDQEPEIYEKAVQTLQKMLQPLQKVRRQRVQGLQEGIEGKNRILQARIRVLRELDSRLGGNKVPRILLRVLDAGLRQYMTLLELRLGMQGDEWASCIETLDRLQRWLSPGFEPDDDYQSQVATTMLWLAQCLAKVSIEPTVTDELLQELNTTLISRLHGQQPAIGVVNVEPGWLLRAYDTTESPLAADSKLRDQLVLGGWWNIAAEGGRPAPMQLIWISQPHGSCAFANRSATAKLELSLAQLESKRVAGLATLGTDRGLPILERSESDLVDAVYRNLAHQSTHDPVTDLLNRKGLLQHMGLIAGMPACEDQTHLLCVLEFDQLQAISYQHGMEALETLLRHLADEVRQRLRPDDLLASLGEDSFAAYLPVCDASEGRHLVSEILAWLKTYRYEHGTDSISVGAYVGMAAFSPGELEAEEVLRRANAACLRAKEMGRNQSQLYRADDTGMKEQESLMEWAGRIDKILDRDGLYLRCQRVTPLNGEAGLKPYYEVLLGVHDPDGAEVGPQPFIEAVERWNRVHDIDRWVVDNVFQWIRANQETFAAIGGFSVNLSAKSLSNEELLAFLHRELSKKDLPVERIMFEITETGAISGYAAAQEFIQQIRLHGCKFCIDDFGSGYASYGHLKNLHTDTLKIDGVFIKDMLQNPADYAMVKSMNEIGHSLGMRVVAEYVATPEILDAVRELGVDYAQGYALHKPMRIDELSQIVTATIEAVGPDPA